MRADLGLLKARPGSRRRDQVEKPPAEPSAPPRARLGAVNPLSIAVAVALLTAGGAFGWRMKTSAPSARPTPEAAAAALALERVDGGSMCSAGGAGRLRDVALRGPEEASPRLGERLPKRSPLPGYERTETRAMEPSTDTQYLSGAVEGSVARFLPKGAGGFEVYAYRYLTRRAAADAIASQVARRVCDLGAVPLSARGRPGLLVLEERGGAMTAWWLAGADVVVVEYRGWGDDDASLANVAAIAGAAALF